MPRLTDPSASLFTPMVADNTRVARPPLMSLPPEPLNPKLGDQSLPSMHQTESNDQTEAYSSHSSSPTAIAFTQRSAPTNNAQRTSATNTPEPYADAGVTDDGAVYAGAALLKGRDEDTGIEAEAFTGSVQVGAQNEAQVGMARVGVSSDDGSNNASMDIFTAQAHAGVYNKDGSTGLNAGATAVAVGVEGTASTGASGVTGGVSIGLGAEFSAGVRDADGDGYGEIGLRGTLELAVGVTIGIQIEDPRGWGVWDYFK